VKVLRGSGIARRGSEPGWRAAASLGERREKYVEEGAAAFFLCE
jgi:hypothetical protein